MKTKPHQLRRCAPAKNIGCGHVTTATTRAPSFSAQTPKGANQLGPLRNRVAPLGFCFKNNDSLSTAVSAPAPTRVPDQMRLHLPLEGTPEYQGINQNREPLTRLVITWRY